MNYFILQDRQMAVRADGASLQVKDIECVVSACKITDQFVEVSSDITVVGLADGTELPAEYKMIPIRQAFADNGFEGCFPIARAKALLEWRRNTKYCGRCGTQLTECSNLTARECPNCGNLIFPRIEPCVIVIVHRDDKILLARHVQRNQDIYACIAGFMEAGETAEEAVAREVMEETGIRIKNVRYYGSQSWPFPAQLMLGFTAEYESGDISLQEEELSDARWFSRDECPAMPQPGSIAYRLIHNS